MTTEAKLKKLEEDQIIMEDQNCKLAKVGLVCHAGTGKAGRCRAVPACLFTCGATVLLSRELLLPGFPRPLGTSSTRKGVFS